MLVTTARLYTPGGIHIYSELYKILIFDDDVSLKLVNFILIVYDEGTKKVKEGI